MHYNQSTHQLSFVRDNQIVGMARRLEIISNPIEVICGTVMFHKDRLNYKPNQSLAEQLLPFNLEVTDLDGEKIIVSGIYDLQTGYKYKYEHDNGITLVGGMLEYGIKFSAQNLKKVKAK